MEYPADCPITAAPTEDGDLPDNQNAARRPIIIYLCGLLSFWGILTLAACNLSDLEESVEGFVKAPQFDAISVSYPTTERDSTIVDHYFGYTIADSYRWLEQDATERVTAWTKAQHALLGSFMSKVPFYEAIDDYLKELSTYYRRGIPSYHGEHYYFTYNPGGWTRDALVRAASLNDSVTIVLNPNTWEVGPSFQLGKYDFSSDGRFLVYEQQHIQTGESSLKVVDLQESLAFDDELLVRGVNTLCWHGDGFYYTTFASPASNRPQLFHRLYYHRLGHPQAEDELIFADQRYPEGRITAYVDTTSNHLILEVKGDGSGNAAYFRPLDSADPSFNPLTEGSDYRFEWAGGTANHLYFLTDRGADKGKLIRISTLQPEAAYWETVIPERGDVIGSVWRLADQWIVDYWRDATSHVLLFSTSGQELRRLHLPEPGTLTGFSQGRNPQELFFGFTSYVRPQTVYRLDAKNYRSALLYSSHPSFSAKDYSMKQEWVTAYDNTPIPIFILYRKGLTLSQPRFTLLLNAQHQQQVQMPQWNASGHHLIPAVLQQGGVVVVANARGSTGFGRRWQNGGRRLQQQQRIDDLQAVAEYLREQDFVEDSRLAVFGSGVGATLVAATLNQRPDLFAAATIENGWYDLLRYHHFLGAVPAQAHFGTVRDSLQNDRLLGCSPLQNVLPNNFPATLLLTSSHSGQGVPLHSRKFAAELQYQQKGTGPILLFGTNAEQSRSNGQQENASAAILSFLFYQTKTHWSK